MFDHGSRVKNNIYVIEESFVLMKRFINWSCGKYEYKSQFYVGGWNLDA